MKKHFSSIERLEARIAPAFAAVIQLSSLDGLIGFKLSGSAGERSGVSVSDAGDVNGDGFADVIVGANYAGANGSHAGASYVIFGKAGGFAAIQSLSTLNGDNGFKLSSVTGGDESGRSASAAGDVNGDGFGDVIIGAPGPSLEGTLVGTSYVVFGKASGFAANLNLSTLDGNNGFKLTGVASGDQCGYSVSAAGDVNGDGFDDVIIGARTADPNGSRSGATYVVFGKANAFAANLNLSSLDGSNGFKLSGVASPDESGLSVSAAGDVNGDGFGDVIIGARLPSPNGANSGASYVVFGKATGFAANLNLSTLNGSNGFKLSGVATHDYAGSSVSAAGDVNGDGFADLIIGAGGADLNGSSSGASYVVFGKASGFTANLNLSTLNGSNGFSLSGVAADTFAGKSVSAAGDINADGFGDLIVGAPDFGSGASYVVFGKASGFTANLNLSTLNGSNGFKLSGISGRSGWSVSAAGDVNGDGFDDVIVGAYTADFTSGASYVVFGRGAAVSISDASVVEGDTGTASLQFTVSLSEPATNPVTVAVGTVNGTALAGNDFAPLEATSLTFAPGETSKIVTVNVLGDTMFESDEAFSAVISAETGVIRDGTGIGAIRNDDAPPLLSIAGDALLEGDSATSGLVFTVSLSAASGLPATVRFGSADGTAVAGSDFTASAPDSQVTFEPGEISKTITVEVIGDTANEGDETFSVALSGATNATIADGIGTGTILNDDAGPVPTISIADVSVTEGQSGTTTASFSVTLSAASTQPVTVQYATSDGSATAAEDYAPVALTTLTFNPGETSKPVLVTINGDTAVESDETFAVMLSNPANATITDGTGLGTILDDDEGGPTRLMVNLSPNGKKATFTDEDGDVVKVNTKIGAFTQENFFVFADGQGGQFQMIDLVGDAAFAGSKINVVAKTTDGGTGDGFVDLGYFNATGIDLNKVKVDGDLGQIDAGDGDSAEPALKGLGVASLGARGLSTQEHAATTTASLHSDLAGDLRKLKVQTNIASGVTLAVDGRLGSAKIGGDLDGATISALGVLNPAKATDALAIGSVKVGGNVSYAQILAGYDRTGAAGNADASIGSVFVANQWLDSDLIAGAAAGPDGRFGTDDDALIAGGNSIIAMIASIVIKGTANGTETADDHFGFVAEEIAAFTFAAVKAALTPGAGNDLAGLPVGSTGDLQVREVRG